LVEPRRTALTSLEVEHADIIGPSIEDIARNKLDAAPAGARIFIAEQCAPWRVAIEEHCTALGATPVWVSPASNAPLPGDFQRGNAALAIAVARDVAGALLDDVLVRRGLAATAWPGRLEILGRDPLIVIDVGHTPDGVRAALDGFMELSADRPRTLVCGVSADKAAEPMLAVLAPHFPRIICAAAHHKGRAAAEVAGIAAAANSAATIEIAESIEDAHRLSLGGVEQSGALYVAGGLFLAAEFKAAHLRLDPVALAFF
jgi:dihydrofolate synthase/folylpolyglutamate synthase